MQKQLKQIGIFFGCIVLPACWSGKQEKEKPVHNNLVVINVLDEDSYHDCHIKGSINVTLDTFEQFAANLDKGTEIVVYCSNYFCSTSDYAAKKLMSLGYKQVYVYEGGLADWYQKGLPVEGPSKAPYLQKQVAKLAESSDGLMVIDAENLAQKMKIDRA